MPTPFSMATIPGKIQTDSDVPDRIEQALKSNSFGVTRGVDSSAAVQWRGRFAVEAAGGKARVELVSVTYYRAARRLRLQVVASDITVKEIRALEDAIAALLHATIISRHLDGDAVMVGPVSSGPQLDGLKAEHRRPPPG